MLYSVVKTIHPQSTAATLSGYTHMVYAVSDGEDVITCDDDSSTEVLQLAVQNCHLKYAFA